MNLSAEGIVLSESDVVNQHDENVGGIGTKPLRLFTPFHRRVEDSLACLLAVGVGGNGNTVPY